MYADSRKGAMGEAFVNLIDRLTDIFTDIYVNLTWFVLENSRLLKQAGYNDFIATKDGRKERYVEMHCWHVFEPRYFCDEKYKPQEYTVDDKCDPSVPDDRRDEQIPPNIRYKLQGDEIVPVVSSDATKSEIGALLLAVNDKPECKPLVRATSRAIRNPVNGNPVDPLRDENWNKAYNQFHSNISMFVHNQTKRPGEQFKMLSHEDFDAMFNPTVQPVAMELRKKVTAAAPDDHLARDYALHSDDDDDPANDALDEESWNRTGIPTPKPDRLTALTPVPTATSTPQASTSGIHQATPANVPGNSFFSL